MSQFKRRDNKKREQQRIYGWHAVKAVLQTDPHTVLEIWMLSARNDAQFRQVYDLARSHSIAVHEVGRDQLDKLVQDNHQGVIAAVQAAAAAGEKDLEAIVAAAGSELLLLVLDGVQDPHNLGACLRTANAVGVHAVIAPKDKAAGLTPVVRKVASGAAESTPFIQVTNLSRTLRWLKEQGVWLAGLADTADKDIYAADLCGPLAFILGAEGKGMRHLTRESCDHLLRIPMAGTVDSLNVSVAAGVCLYEAVRQRSGIAQKSG
jgi:23S rRNA (guanosine2251-2'-O)-methyltransferase